MAEISLAFATSPQQHHGSLLSDDLPARLGWGNDTSMSLTYNSPNNNNHLHTHSKTKSKEVVDAVAVARRFKFLRSEMDSRVSKVDALSKDLVNLSKLLDGAVTSQQELLFKLSQILTAHQDRVIALTKNTTHQAPDSASSNSDPDSAPVGDLGRSSSSRDYQENQENQENKNEKRDDQDAFFLMETMHDSMAHYRNAQRALIDICKRAVTEEIAQLKREMEESEAEASGMREMLILGAKELFQVQKDEQRSGSDGLSTTNTNNTTTHITNNSRDHQDDAIVHLCPVCFEHEATICCAPCGHTVCNHCIFRLRSANICSCCRSQVTDFVRIYYSL
jgi:hypothetical protein